MADAWDNKEFNEAIKYVYRGDYSKIGDLVGALESKLNRYKRNHDIVVARNYQLEEMVNASWWRRLFKKYKASET